MGGFLSFMPTATTSNKTTNGNLKENLFVSVFRSSPDHYWNLDLQGDFYFAVEMKTDIFPILVKALIYYLSWVTDLVRTCLDMVEAWRKRWRLFSLGNKYCVFNLISAKSGFRLFGSFF